MKYVGFGDLLVSLSPSGYHRFVQVDSFDANYTGAEANVCVGLAQLGEDAFLVSRIPAHAVADSAIACLRKYGVHTDYVARGGSRMGVLYLEKGASQRGSRVIYDREHTAFAGADAKDYDWNAILSGCDWFHFTGITAALGPTLPNILLDALRCAKERGIRISCDLNYRKKLWSRDEAKRVMTRLLPYVDLLIANEEDADMVLGIRAEASDVEAGILSREGYEHVAMRIAGEYGIPMVAITLRQSISASDNVWSAMLYVDGKAYFSTRYQVHLVDRIGGGDSFAAGLLYALGHAYEPQQAIAFAAAASCLKQTIEKDFNLATLDEVNTLINGHGTGRVQR